MTFGEMNSWTQRFLQIIGAAQCLKEQRLKNLRDDLVQAYEGKKFDPFAGYLFAAISEQVTG